MADHVPGRRFGSEPPAGRPLSGLGAGLFHPVLAEDAQPTAYAAAISSGVCVLLTATKVTSAGSRPSAPRGRGDPFLDGDDAGLQFVSLPVILLPTSDERRKTLDESSVFVRPSSFVLRLFSQHHHRPKMARLPPFGAVRVEVIRAAGGADSAASIWRTPASTSQRRFAAHRSK